MAHTANKNVVTNIIETIGGQFGKMTVTRGKDHVFLGMDISFLDNRTVSVNMKDCIKEAMADFGEKHHKKRHHTNKEEFV
jgi:hypothetical protein